MKDSKIFRIKIECTLPPLWNIGALQDVIGRQLATTFGNDCAVDVEEVAR
jgi:hypothetical protein